MQENMQENMGGGGGGGGGGVFRSDHCLYTLVQYNTIQ